MNSVAFMDVVPYVAGVVLVGGGAWLMWREPAAPAYSRRGRPTSPGGIVKWVSALLIAVGLFLLFVVGPRS